MRGPRGFRFDEFDAACAELDAAQLQLKWQHYTRALSAASSSTAVATLAAGPTGGISMIGAIIAGPLMHNARKKRQIIERHMTVLGAQPETRKKDIYAPALVSGLLGGATAGIGLGAEALAVDKATKIIGHVIGDGILTKVEEKHAAKKHAKEVAEHMEGQLVHSNTMPALMPVMALGKKKEFGEMALKHINSVPGAMGSTANGLLASAARIKAQNYPVLKEYLSTFANQSRNFMSRSRSTDDRVISETPGVIATLDTPPRSRNSRVMASHNALPRSRSADSILPDSHISELEGSFSYMEPVVSPLESTCSVFERDISPDQVSPCGTEFSELEGDSAWDNLLKVVDESTLAEIEEELERAVEEMDIGAMATLAEAESEADKRTSRTFHNPTDLDTIVRRQSTRYNKRLSVRRAPSSSDMSRSLFSSQSSESLSLSDRSITASSSASYRRPVPRAFRQHTFDDLPELPSPTDTILPYYSETDPTSASASTVSFHKGPSRPMSYNAGMDEKQVVDNVHNPFSTSGEASRAAQYHFSRTQSWVDEKRAARDPILHTRHPSVDDYEVQPPPSYYDPTEKEVVYTEKEAVVAGPSRPRGPMPSSSYGSSRRMIMSDPSDPNFVVGTASTWEDPEFSQKQTLDLYHPWDPSASSSSYAAPSIAPSATPSTLSRTGTAALSAHQGMKKVGYFGLEPAAKLAIGGSLLLMGVRPSVQRKMLDKAKNKMGMPDKDDY